MEKENNKFGQGVRDVLDIDVKALVMDVLDHMLLIIMGGLLAGMITFLLCSTVLHLNYESTTKIYIRPQGTDATSDYVALEIGSMLTTDYQEMITGRDVVEEAILHFNIDLPYEKFVKKIKVDNPTDTRILSITVRDKDPYKARNMAIFIRDKAITMIEERMGIEGISICEEANLPIRNVITPKMLSAIVAFLVCCMLGVIVVIRFMMTDRIVTADDVESKLGIQVLGSFIYEKGKM